MKFFVCRHVSIWEFQYHVCLSVRTPRTEITLASSISVLQYNWYINGKVFTSNKSWKPKNLNFSKRNSKLNFELCQRVEINIQVGLNMHLYDDIRDAVLSLLGLIFTLFIVLYSNNKWHNLTFFWLKIYRYVM